MKKMNKKGFTIVELVIVIAVIAILAGVMIPTFSGIVTKANDSAALQEARAAISILLAEKDGQIPDNTYVVYKKNETDTPKWFEYENGKLVSASPVTFASGDTVYAKQSTPDIITGTNITATVLSDLSANVEIITDNTN